MSWSLPIKTPFMRTQAGHRESMQYAIDIYETASRLKNFSALEIGGAWGFSTLAILEAGAKHLTTVDNNVKVEAPNEAKVNGYTNHVWTCSRSDAFWEETSTKFDLIYVDGSHLYDDVKNDLYQAWEHLNSGGLLLADDWDHKNNIEVDLNGKYSKYGVSLACWEFWRDNPCEAGIHGRVLWFAK